MKKKRVPASVPHEPFLLKHLSDRETSIHFLSDAFETGNVQEILQAIGLVLKAKNKAKLSDDLGVHRTSLYKMFSRKGKPAFETVLKTLEAFDVHLKVDAKVAA